MIVFTEKFKGEAGIIFGINGFPPLPTTDLGKKTIQIPNNGIIITSTKVEDIPTIIRYSYRNGHAVDYNRIDWNPNFEYSCIVNNSIIKAWLFTVDKQSSLQVREKVADLANEIIIGRVRTIYSTTDSGVWEDNKGKYLWLQNRDLNFLPDSISNLNVYKAILTNNNFTEIPKQILALSSLEDLLIGHNLITEITPELHRLKRLKSLTLNATKIKEIKTDLSRLDSLTDFDFSSNEVSYLPNEVKNIPNLTWLALNNNNFSSLSFIDKRLSKLQTLYLYTNQLKSISTEIKLLPNLKQLLIFDNEIDSIPASFSALINLEKLEIWDNPIKFISPEIKKLKKLKEIRLDDDYLTTLDKQHLKEWLPNCTIHFQTRKDNQ